MLKLLSNDIAKLLDILLDIYRNDQTITSQVVSSLSVLSLSTEGITYLNNTPDLINHLKQALTVITNSDHIKTKIGIILKNLGCVITLIVCYIYASII